MFEQIFRKRIKKNGIGGLSGPAPRFQLAGKSQPGHASLPLPRSRARPHGASIAVASPAGRSCRVAAMRHLGSARSATWVALPLPPRSSLSFALSLACPRSLAIVAAAVAVPPSRHRRQALEARRWPDQPPKLTSEGTICLSSTFSIRCSRSTIVVSLVVTTIAHRSELELRRALGSRGHSSSIFLWPRFHMHCIRLALPQLINLLANPIPAGAASPAVSRATALPCAVDHELHLSPLLFTCVGFALALPSSCLPRLMLSRPEHASSPVGWAAVPPWPTMSSP